MLGGPRDPVLRQERYLLPEPVGPPAYVRPVGAQRAPTVRADDAVAERSHLLDPPAGAMSLVLVAVDRLLRQPPVRRHDDHALSSDALDRGEQSQAVLLGQVLEELGRH